MKRFKILVQGKVQGVGFRFFATTKAKPLNITGLCKNLDNGDVYIEAQGNEENIITFTNNLKKGNRFIKISEIVLIEIPLINDEKKFKMEY